MERNKLFAVIAQKTGFTNEDVGKTIDALHENAKNSTGKTNRKKQADELSRELNMKPQKIDQIILCYFELLLEG